MYYFYLGVKGHNESQNFKKESLQKAIKCKESENNMIKGKFEDKHATNIQRINDRNDVINSLKSINGEFRNENIDLKINAAKENSDSDNIIEKQIIKKDRIEEKKQ